MSDRNTKMVNAALQTFLRYGVGKTTMNDIASAAGVSRQTLYNSYTSKEEILRAAVQHVIATTFEDVEKAWAEAPDLSAKLDTFFDVSPLKAYDIAHGSPEGIELFDGIHRVAKEELQHATLRWNDIFAELVREYAAKQSDVYENAAEFGAFIYATSINAKYNAETRDVLVTRLEYLKKSVLALIAPATG